MKKTFIIILLAAIGFGSRAQNTKSYSLFKPVPKENLREMETDRPDVTESPQTIDAGHFQYETDLFRLERQRYDDVKNDTYFINKANLKLGITNSTAIQLVVESFVLNKKKSGDVPAETNRGLGDLTLRIKQNLLGNDDGNFAIALLPYVKFPTSHADEESAYEGGFILPMALKVGSDWKLGMQLEADRLQDNEGKGHHNELLQTFTVSHPIIKKLDGVGETYYTYDLKEKHWSNYLNFALQYELAKDIKFDAGVNYGVQHEADKSYFLGFSVRL